MALRYFNVFGPRQDPDSQYAAVSRTSSARCWTASAPVIYGDGEQSRDFTYVENVVHANLLALDAPGVAGRVYNVACGERDHRHALLAAAVRAARRRRPRPRSGRRGRPTCATRTPTSRAPARCWATSRVVSLREGLERTVRAWPRTDSGALIFAL